MALNAAMVGAWHVHFDQYATEFSSREDCNLTALWDDDPVRGESCAKRYSCDFEPDYDALLARPDVDAILITSATNLHPQLIEKAAKAGKHIFTEKVLCFTTQEALRLKQLVEEAGVKFSISFVWRSRSDMLGAKQIVEQGLLGEITYARMRNAHDGALAGWLPEHFYDPEACGGGAMMDLGAHPMYLLPWMLGQPVSVSSCFTSVTGKAVEDNAVSVLEFTNGAIGVSETGFTACCNPPSLEICGAKGSLFWGGALGGMMVNTGDGFAAPQLPETPKTPLDCWVDEILYGAENPFTLDDAVNLTRMMEAAYRSQKEGRKVFLSEL